MNGQYATKGYILQSLVALLDSFEEDWETICVEPNDESEKVDIKWTFSNSIKKAVQVKSSKNLITYSLAKKWADELAKSTPNAVLELVLVGNKIENKITTLTNNKIGTVIISTKSLSIDDFENIILSKINSFFEKNGKNNVAPSLGKLFVRALNQQILNNSVIGKSVNQYEFKEELLNSLQSVESHLKRSAYNLLLPNNAPPEEDVRTTIMNHFLSLIGWRSLNKNEKRHLYDEKTGQDKEIQIDYWGEYECPLKDNVNDIIYINADVVAQYPDTPSSYYKALKDDLYNVDYIRNQLISEDKIDVSNSIEHCIQFMLSLNESEKGLSSLQTKDVFKDKILNKNIIYHSVDNKKADFIISSVITARKYREDLVVKFLYPITEDNSQLNRIGKRSAYLPPQYLSSSILPIIKEDRNKISVLLFCSDCYNKERLKKIIWMLIKLTSGLANEYKIFFPDYDNQYTNEVAEVFRSYNNNDLTEKISLEKLTLCNSTELQSVPSIIEDNLKDEEFDETLNENRKLKIEAHLIEYLPYGDMLKPFLTSETIKADFLRMFLQGKGIFFRTADRTRIIQLMTSMLFSPVDIELLVAYAEVKDKPLEANTIQYPLVDSNSNISYSLSKVNFNQNEIKEGLKANIISFNVVKPINDNEELIINAFVEQNNPNKQALISKVVSTVRVVAKKDTLSNKLEITKEHNSRPARIIAERIAKQLSEQLIQRNTIEDQSIEIRFSDFSNNRERINFLLSFTNIESSAIFSSFNAKSFKYMFDESADLPEEYEDKKGKECVLELKGRNLDQIRELQNDSLKNILLGESMAINYRFNYRGITGNYFVVVNFSNALSNKPNPDGLFNIKYAKMHIDNRCMAKVTNIKTFESELKKHFNQFKKEKLAQFNII